MQDFIRVSDISPLRLVARWRCHRNVQRCQHVDRPNDNRGPTWVTRLIMWARRLDPADYGY